MSGHTYLSSRVAGMWARRSGRAQFVAGDGPLVQAFGMFQTPDIEGKLLCSAVLVSAGVQWRTHHVHEAFELAQRRTPLDLFAYSDLEQFARGGARQCLVDHHGVLGDLELGELPAAVLDDGRQIYLCAIAVEDGANLLTHDVVWDGEDGGVGDTRRCQQHTFDLHARDVLPSADDDVFDPVDDVDAARVVDTHNVPGVHPSVDDRGGGGLWAIPVPVGDIGSAGYQFADAGVVGDRNDAQVDGRDSVANRVGVLDRITVRQHGDQRRRLCHAVAVH